MSDESKDKNNFLDLSELSNFQFGPAWAKGKQGGQREYKKDFQGGKSSRSFKGRDRRPREDGDRPYRDGGDRRSRQDGGDRPYRERGDGGDRRYRGEGRNDRRPQRPRFDRSTLVPTEKVRVEIRPVDSGLSTLASEIQKHKRCYSLYDLAKVVMGSRDRYEIWYIKEDQGPDFYYCKKAPAVWLNQEDALSYLWRTPIIEEYYTIVVEGDHKSWKPKREGAEDILFVNEADVEADILAHAFSEIYDITHKCFVQGDISGKKLDSGLFAHLLKNVESARFHPSQIIPNICHGLARHHLPLFKWNNGHHTGPSRPHAVPADMVLADRLQSILTWVKDNGGKGVDVMLHELAAPMPEEGEPSEEILKVHGEWVADLLWLLQEGYVLVMADGKVHLAKQAGSQTTKDDSKKAKSKKKKSPKSDASESKSQEAKAEKVADDESEKQPLVSTDEAPEVVVEDSVETATEEEVVETIEVSLDEVSPVETSVIEEAQSETATLESPVESTEEPIVVEEKTDKE